MTSVIALDLQLATKRDIDRPLERCGYSFFISREVEGAMKSHLQLISPSVPWSHIFPNKDRIKARSQPFKQVIHVAWHLVSKRFKVPVLETRSLFSCYRCFTTGNFRRLDVFSLSKKPSQRHSFPRQLRRGPGKDDYGPDDIEHLHASIAVGESFVRGSKTTHRDDLGRDSFTSCASCRPEQNADREVLRWL